MVAHAGLVEEDKGPTPDKDPMKDEVILKLMKEEAPKQEASQSDADEANRDEGEAQISEAAVAVVSRALYYYKQGIFFDTFPESGNHQLPVN